MNLKSIITLIITIVLSSAFCYVVVQFADENIANMIVTQFLTIATSVIGFFIGYQTNKIENNKDK
jgi:hypothetical protein